MAPLTSLLPTMESIREFINNLLDRVEEIDFEGYYNAASTVVSLRWIRPEWFQWRNHYVPIAIAVFFFWPVIATLILALTAASTWLFWLITSLVFGLLQLIYVSYQFIMIFSDILILSMFKTYSMLRAQLLYYIDRSVFQERKSRRRVWRKKVEEAGTYENFLKIPIDQYHVPRPKEHTRGSSFSGIMIRSSSFGELEGSPKRQGSPLSRNYSFHSPSHEDSNVPSLLNHDADSMWIMQELGKKGAILNATTTRLREARQQASSQGTTEASYALKYLLSGVVKRNHLTLEEILVQNARSVAESGSYGLSQNARILIKSYYEEVEKCLDWIADSSLDSEIEPLTPSLEDVNSFGRGFEDVASEKSRQNELSDRITLVRKMKQNMGRTALMLSGGGAQSMYHAGTIRALVESGLYDDIKVISGTSGGSITAAMCALKTADELLKDVCVRTVSTDFMLTGEMKKKNIRWFPTVMEMGACWLKHSLLVDSAEFKRCCDFYFGDYTFEEAFEKTGKHVCITVSASRATGGTAQRLLLNHISTPHVTLSSAVAASCALPGVMAPAKLMAKDSTGHQEPFEVDGVEWIDGSVQADLPFERISTLFNVSNYVVCQTNFHVLPFLNKAHHPNEHSTYWTLFQTVEWDIRNRALKLSRLGLFPRIFGQDISKVFKQKYHGNLTLVPRFTAMQTFGLKALANPTVSDMENYLKYGQIAAWPYLNVISDMIRLERALDECLARLHERRSVLIPEIDDMESITSAPTSTGLKGVRFLSVGREAEHLKKKVIALEQENLALKAQLEELRSELNRMPHSGDDVEENGYKSPPSPSPDGGRTLSEKEVWILKRTYSKD